MFTVGRNRSEPTLPSSFDRNINVWNSRYEIMNDICIYFDALSKKYIIELKNTSNK
jgi:hypothetical protein